MAHRGRGGVAESEPVDVGTARPAGGRPAEVRPALALTVLVAVAHGAASFPALYNGYYRPERWTGPVDFTGHTDAASRIFPHWWEPGLPHFLLHLMARLVAWLLRSESLSLGMLVVTVATMSAFGVAVFRFLCHSLRGSPRAPAIAAVLSLLLAFGESPTALWGGWSFQNPPDFYLSLTNPNSQTHLGSHVFGFVLLLSVVECLRDPDGRWRPWLAPLAVVATLVKPNLSPVLAVLALGWAWHQRRGDVGRRRLRLVWWHLSVPVLAIVAAQAWILTYQTPVLFPEVGARDVVFAPFQDLVELGGQHPAFWGVALFPVVALAVFRKELLSPVVRMAGACLLVQLGLASTFAITGELYGADFWWTSHIGFLVVCVAMAGRIGELVVGDPHRWRNAAVVAGLAWLPYAVAGFGLWTCEGSGASCLSL